MNYEMIIILHFTMVYNIVSKQNRFITRYVDCPMQIKKYICSRKMGSINYIQSVLCLDLDATAPLQTDLQPNSFTNMKHMHACHFQ